MGSWQVVEIWCARRDSRRINNLDRVRPFATNCDGCLVQQGFPAMARHSSTLSRVWWWAQNWAQSRKGLPGRCKAPQGYDTSHDTKFHVGAGGSLLSCPGGEGDIDGDAFPSVRDSLRASSKTAASAMNQTKNTDFYCSFAYSALASFRMGMSGSASFQSERKSL